MREHRMPTEQSLLLPTIIGLGPPKSGTSALHSCLTSPAFTPQPCCGGAKEPGLFLHPVHMVSSLWRQQHAVPGAEVLDFTTLYLGAPAAVAKQIMASIKEPSRLHFVVVLRDPVERALSQFCMFARGGPQIQWALKTAATCRARIGTDCQRDPHACDGLRMWGDGFGHAARCSSIGDCLARWRERRAQGQIAPGRSRTHIKVASMCPNATGGVLDCGEIRPRLELALTAADREATIVPPSAAVAAAMVEEDERRHASRCVWRSNPLVDKLRGRGVLHAIPEASDASGGVDLLRLAALAVNSALETNLRTPSP